VYAVDPADVPMAVGRGPDAVDHMRCLGSAAIANLLAAPERVQLAAFVQDANVPTAGVSFVIKVIVTAMPQFIRRPFTPFSQLHSMTWRLLSHCFKKAARSSSP